MPFYKRQEKSEQIESHLSQDFSCLSRACNLALHLTQYYFFNTIKCRAGSTFHECMQQYNSVLGSALLTGVSQRQKFMEIGSKFFKNCFTWSSVIKYIKIVNGGRSISLGKVLEGLLASTPYENHARLKTGISSNEQAVYEQALNLRMGPMLYKNALQKGKHEESWKPLACVASVSHRFFDFRPCEPWAGAKILVRDFAAHPNSHTAKNRKIDGKRLLRRLENPMQDNAIFWYWGLDKRGLGQGGWWCVDSWPTLG